MYICRTITPCYPRVEWNGTKSSGGGITPPRPLPPPVNPLPPPVNPLPPPVNPLPPPAVDPRPQPAPAPAPVDPWPPLVGPDGKLMPWHEPDLDIDGRYDEQKMQERYEAELERERQEEAEQSAKDAEEIANRWRPDPSWFNRR